MNKKGSHIDVVLSFVIFVFVLIFILSLLTPKMESSKQKSILTNSIKNAIIENSSYNLTFFTLKIDDVISKDCVNISENFANNIIGESADKTKFVIKNETDILNYDLQDNKLFIKAGIRASGFLKFYYSENLDSSYCDGCVALDCTSINNYEIGMVRKDKVVFVSKIRELVSIYDNNYESLRSELKLPPDVEFAFTFIENNGTAIKAERDIPETVNVYVMGSPILYLNENGKFLEGELSVKIW